MIFCRSKLGNRAAYSCGLIFLQDHPCHIKPLLNRQASSGNIVITFVISRNIATACNIQFAIWIYYEVDI